MENYHEEKKIIPIHILVVFLLGLAAILFIIGSIGSFDLESKSQNSIVIITTIIYIIIAIAFLYPHKKKTMITPPEPEVIERIKTIEKPVIVNKEIIKYRDKPVEHKIIEVEKIKPIIIEKEKPEIKKSKYVGSSYNEKYHLRTCRFSGVIKKKYLVEEDDKKYFKLRGYAPCKVCKPNLIHHKDQSSK